ncbi:MAG: hypothetical protein GXP25_04860 [Planctomycetes bacterium]|nr:hypothetical protein [Planctomycetota bacterium]
MAKKFGFSFSWKRAFGISSAKGKISRKIGIPLSRSGRQRKVGRLLGCCVILLVFAISATFLSAGVTILLWGLIA